MYIKVVLACGAGQLIATGVSTAQAGYRVGPWIDARRAQARAPFRTQPLFPEPLFKIICIFVTN